MIKRLFLSTICLASATPYSVGQTETITDQIQNGSIIRFTVGLRPDTAFYGKNEFSIKQRKKYVYVDVSQTENISPEDAQKAFSNANSWYCAAKQGEAVPKDFTDVGEKYEYGNFPWLTSTIIEPAGYYYKYDKKAGRIEKKVFMKDPYTCPALLVWFMWISLISAIAYGIKKRIYKRPAYLAMVGLVLCLLFGAANHLSYCYFIFGIVIVILLMPFIMKLYKISGLRGSLVKIYNK